MCFINILHGYIQPSNLSSALGLVFPTKQEYADNEVALKLFCMADSLVIWN